MTLAEAVLTVLLGLPPFHAEPDPESSDERRVRLTQAAIVITGAAHARSRSWKPVKLAAALIVLGKRESSFARYVWAGECMRGPVGARCDPHRGVARARGYWQGHYRSCRAGWAEEHGSLAEQYALASCAASLLQGASHRCARRAMSPEAGAFAGYRGIDCAWTGGRSRALELHRTESRLRTLMASPALRPRASARP